ncbi:alkene reductase [Thermomonas sp. HDW16]|uniref:alkene reductase n=1 Tax=Thermomonas sp. HDW16 TaxID=2714945 RepID=UPI00140E38D9|nr:alkene reductase [Thermomonas sp. HDW16]QIL19338.1 alkene reductase [Thermomonas sp. HDW16]
MTALFSPLSLGDLTLSNRIVMAPMTRNRADEHGVPTPMMATHYGQRGDAGLIVSESSPVSAQGVGYPHTPGLFDAAQASAWRAVTDAVHARGGRTFAQLQHCGRISHPSLQRDGALPVAPSPIRPRGQAVTASGMQDFVTPCALRVEEIPGVIDQFKQAARHAQAAGFDGVEIHGANGYLIDQFLRDGSNQRIDAYGGTPARRLTLLMEIIEAVAEVWPRQRIGVRLSPENRFNDMSDSDPATHFAFHVGELSRAGLAYLHVLEGDMSNDANALDYRALRRCFDGAYIANNGYDRTRAQQALRNGDADLVAFGTAFLANPDLVTRLRHGWPLNAADPSTFYGGDERGYIDYPAYDMSAETASP